MKHLKVLAILFSLMMSFSLFAQEDYVIDLTILNPNALVFPVGDLDFTNTGLSSNYFNVKFQNNTSASINLRLRMEIKYNGIQIAVGNSDPFDLPGNYLKVITSQELSAGTAEIGGQLIKLGDYDVDFNVVEDLENQIIQTGRAPAGEYRFILIGIPTSPQIPPIEDPNPGDNTISIINPTYIELLFPGMSVSESIIPQINTLYPYFQYQTDVPPASASYNVFVYQKYPEDETTQDVLNHPPIFHIEGYPNNFLQYPTDTQALFGEGTVLALRMLEEGGIYYWLAQSIIPSGTGTVILESDIFRFKIAEAAQGANNAQQILAVLQQILGSRYEQVLSDLRAQGFDPNGNFVYGGRNVDINALFELASQIARGEKQIENVEVY